MPNFERKYILALETAVNGGSISILDNDLEIDYINGSNELPKSVDILILLDQLLKRNNIGKNQIKLVAISTGAGSLTGLRIGKAFALGVGNSLNIPVLEIDVFDALNLNNIISNAVFAIIYAGNNKILYKEFSIEKSELTILNSDELLQKFCEWKLSGDTSIIMSENLQEILTDEDWKEIKIDPQIQIVGGNLAKIIGLKAKRHICV